MAMTFDTKSDSGVIPPIGSPGGKVLNVYSQFYTEDKKKCKKACQFTLKIATWNVRSMFMAGKIHNAILEMKRLKIDILGISEMRWPGSGECEIGEYKIYYAGNEGANHYNGVAIIVTKNIAKSITAVIPISDRVILMKLNSRPFNTNIIQVYAPTSDCAEDVLEKFYTDLNDAIKLVKSSENTITIGDFNAIVGKGECQHIVGAFGLGKRNDRGDRLIQFCHENDFVITNTYFKLPPRRLYTWKSCMDADNRIVRNQIDYILIKHRFRNSVLSAKTYPGADIGSDHNPVVAVTCNRLKRTVRSKCPRTLNRLALNDEDTKNKIRDQINSCLKSQHFVNTNAETQWNTLSSSIKDICLKNLGYVSVPKRKQWMTDEIIELMEQRRLLKNNKEPYKILQNIIRQKIRNAKVQHLSNQCTEIEELEAKYDSFNMHKKVKEAAGIITSKKFNLLYDENGKVIQTLEEKLHEWSKYITNLFEDNRANIPPELTTLEGPLITSSEVEYAIKHSKNRKAVGPDEIPCEIYKLIEDSKALANLTTLFNKIYTSGKIPTEWSKSVFITLPKKAVAKTCGDYRTISLMSHLLKIFLKVIHGRIYYKCEQYLSESQFGFRNGFGTREALFGINVLAQRCRDMSVDLYGCFIDFQKAFDRVQHEVLIDTLRDIGLDGKDIRVISNLYWGQSAVVRIDGVDSTAIEIKRGVRQGCILSPILFNVYSEKIFRDALSEESAGLVVNGEIINNLRYADDTVLLASSHEDLQHILDRVVEKCDMAGLDLNIKKTKVLVISKQPNIVTNILVKGKTLQQVNQIKYLGSILTNNADSQHEIRARIEQARVAFKKLSKVLCCRDLRLTLRIRLLRCYVFSTLLYGMEAWTMNAKDIKRLEAFEMWSYRRILRVSWIEKVRNTEILSRLNKSCEILVSIKRRKLQYFGHLMRGEKYRLLQNIMQGKIAGRRAPGRRKTSWLKNLRDWYGVTSGSLFRLAFDKLRIAMMVTNVLKGHGT